MTKIKTHKLSGAALDWAVASAKGYKEIRVFGPCRPSDRGWVEVRFNPEPQAATARYDPSENWAQAGPIIDRENISVVCCQGDYVSSTDETPGYFVKYWIADIGMSTRYTTYGPQGDDFGECFSIDADCMTGETPLIAAMRCYVASKMGEEVEIPEELL